jgi:hypothetical protein
VNKVIQVMRGLLPIVSVLLILLVVAAGCTDEDTGVPATPVADPVLPGQVLVNTGYVTGDGIAGGTIDNITITVGLVPGAKPVDMEKISIYYADTIRTETLLPVKNFRGAPPEGYWGIMGVNNEIGNPNNRLEDKEQFVLRLNPRSHLVANRMITIVIRSPGASTPLTIQRVAPATLVAQGNILTSP